MSQKRIITCNRSNIDITITTDVSNYGWEESRKMFTFEVDGKIMKKFIILIIVINLCMLLLEIPLIFSHRKNTMQSANNQVLSITRSVTV